MRYIAANHLALYLWLAVAALTFVVVFASFFYGEIAGTGSGLNICPSDCNDYNNLSQYIADHRKLYSREVADSIVGEGDSHGSFFHMGFTSYVAVLKMLFGERWDIAYLVGHGVLAVAALAVSTRALVGRWSVQPFTLAAVAFICGNLIAVKFVKWLLPDFGFAFIALCAFVLTAQGVMSRQSRILFAGLLIAALSVFVRPNGALVLAITVGTALVALVLPARFRFRWIYLGPIAIGAAGMIAIWILSTQSMTPSRFGLLELPKAMLAKINLYGGGDSPPADGRFTALIVNQPYKQAFRHDGQLSDMVLTSLIRLPKLFELQYYDQSYRERGVNPLFDSSTSVYKRLLNGYRLLYYLALYALAVTGIVMLVARRRSNPIGLVLICLYAGYLLAFVAMSHVVLRYRLPFDIAAIVIAAYAVHSIWSDWGVQRWQSLSQRLLRQRMPAAEHST